MRLSSLADYAVVMLVAAARRGGAVRCSATDLAGETGVPLPTAQKLVSRLAAAGLVESARGTGGGFRLSRSADAISLADVIEAVEGPIQLTACVEGERHDCALDHRCAVKPHWGVVNAAVRGALGGVSLASLSGQPGEGRGRGRDSAAVPAAMMNDTERSMSHNRAPAFAGAEE